MNSALLALICLFCFFVAYRFYSKFLANKVFSLPEITEKTPAHQLRDGIDFVPTKKNILFGHHFSSIAGAAPIVGPAIAVMWGWLPAVIWIVVGVVFIGACHDMGALYLSMKHQGQSLGNIAETLLGKRVRALFLLVIFFLIWMVIAVFALVIANLFISFPSSVIPVNFEIVIALIMGLLINRKNKSLKVPSLLAQIALLFMIWVGTLYPVSITSSSWGGPLMIWMVLLLIYGAISSTMPVWLLLQPRDYINSHQLVLGLTLLTLGLIVTHPPIVAPAINPNPVGAPPLFPFLFITIACGAISGFHGLVSGGTTSKQVNRWSDVRPIGYGAMIGEGILALLATLAATAGFSSSVEWHSHYSSWQEASGLNQKISAFVIGSGHFLAGLGIPVNISQTIIAVLIISFAATSLDTAVRIQRYIIGEVGGLIKAPALSNRHVGAWLAVGLAFLLMLSKSGGKGGLLLWPLFGATNQMLASLALLVVALYLRRHNKAYQYYFYPAVFVAIITTISLITNIGVYFKNGDFFLVSTACALLVAQLWIAKEAFHSFQKNSENSL